MANTQHAALDPSSLGNILVRLGAVTMDQLHQACRHQRVLENVLLGDVLVQLQALDSNTRDAALDAQRVMRIRGPERTRAILAKAEEAKRSTVRMIESLEQLRQTYHSVQGRLK